MISEAYVVSKKSSFLIIRVNKYTLNVDLKNTVTFKKLESCASRVEAKKAYYSYHLVIVFIFYLFFIILIAAPT